MNPKYYDVLSGLQAVSSGLCEEGQVIVDKAGHLIASLRDELDSVAKELDLALARVAELEAELNSRPKLVWSGEPPTEPGLYLIRQKRTGRVFLWRHESGHSQENAHYYYWHGPILESAEPQEGGRDEK